MMLYYHYHYHSQTVITRMTWQSDNTYRMMEVLGYTLCLFHIAMEAMAHRNRWFYLLKMGGFSMANCES